MAKRTGKRDHGRQRKAVGRRTTHTLELGKLVKFSKIKDERFEGLDITRTEEEQRPAILRLLRGLPWLLGVALLTYRWWTGV